MYETFSLGTLQMSNSFNLLICSHYNLLGRCAPKLKVIIHSFAPGVTAWLGLLPKAVKKGRIEEQNTKRKKETRGEKQKGK